MQFAKRIEGLKPSDIQEMFKLAADPKVISFASGVPDSSYFPIKEMERLAGIILSENGEQALQYGATEGYIPLREKIAARMKKDDIDTSVDNIMVTTGSQQGLELSAKTFLNEGDAVVCENPSYAGAISAFKSYLPEFVEINTDEHGMIMEELEKALELKDNIKMIYVIPDFQNPTGKSWSLERRKKLIKLANYYDIPVIVDDAYGDVCFNKEKAPSLRSFDTERKVIHLGTFSKTLCSGLRVGWVEADIDVLKKYIIIKQSSDMHTNILAQMMIDKYLELYDIDAHIAEINSVYKARRDTMIEAIKEHFPANCTYTYPEGGMFIWVEMPGNIDAREVLMESIKENVAFIPGEPFYPNGGVKNTFRLNFSNANESKIKEGIERLSKVLKQFSN